MDASELLYEAKQLALRVHPRHRAEAARMVDAAERELEDLEARLRELIGWLEARTTTTEVER